MKCDRWIRPICLFVTVILLSGCVSGPGQKEPIQPGNTVLTVEVEWDRLCGPVLPAFAGAADFTVTSVGARLVYPGENAAFAQAVSRETASAKGIITLEVPSTDHADLYLAAVDAEQEVVLAYGLAEGLRLQADSVRTLTMDDIKWVDAEWFVEEEFANSLKKGEFHVPKDEAEVYVFAYVRDPFQEGRQPSYETSFIGMWGTFWMLDNVDGWLGFQAVLRNRTPGIPNEAREWLQPCLSGLPFNLGNQGYAIPPVVRKVIVIWE